MFEAEQFVGIGIMDSISGERRGEGLRGRKVERIARLNPKIKTSAIIVNLTSSLIECLALERV
jgi:hypothetical protein